jgi:hypothetical protein
VRGINEDSTMNYNNSALRLRTKPAPRAADSEEVFSIETDARGTHLRVRKASTLLRRTLRPLAATALASMALMTSVQAVLIQPLTEAVSKDIKIYANTPTMNFSSNLSITSSFISLVQFDLSSVSQMDLLNASSIKLTLYCTGIGVSGTPTPVGGDVTIAPLLGGWRESASEPGADPVALYPVFFGPTATVGIGAVAATQTVTGAGFVSWDITALAKSWANGTLANNGVIVRLNNNPEFGDIGFADVDSNPEVAGSAPALDVVPEPGSALALSAGLGVLLSSRRRRTMHT